MPYENFTNGTNGYNPVPSGSGSHIVDIRSRYNKDDLLLQGIKDGLKTPKNAQTPRHIPSLLLWDEEGLKRFEDITYLDEYYLTTTEIDILEKSSKEIAQRIKRNSILLELGSGNLRKITILLRTLDALAIPVDYYALDLSLPELKRTLALIPPGTYTHIRCHGLLGTYDDGRAWLQRPENTLRPQCIVFLGSTIGSFTRPDAGAFLASFANVLHGPKNAKPADDDDYLILIGLDGCKDGAIVWDAYNDAKGTNRGFVLNALRHANRVLGYEAFRDEDWEVKGEWDENEASHNQYVVPRVNVSFWGGEVKVKKGEKVLVVQSRKYGEEERKEVLWIRAGVREVWSWTGGEAGSYGIHMLSPLVKVREV